MFNSALIRSPRSYKNLRQITTNFILRDAKPTAKSTPNNVMNDLAEAMTIVPSNFDKRILVWMKRYPSIDAIPPKIKIDVLQKANSRARIRVCNYMILFTCVACLWVIVSGRMQVAEKLKTLDNTNDELRRKINEEYRASRRAESAKDN